MVFMTSSRLLLSAFFFLLATGCAHTGPAPTHAAPAIAIQESDPVEASVDRASCEPLPEGVGLGVLPSGMCGAIDEVVFWDGEMCVRTSSVSCLIGPFMTDISDLTFFDELACQQAHQHCDVQRSCDAPTNVREMGDSCEAPNGVVYWDGQMCVQTPPNTCLYAGYWVGIIDHRFTHLNRMTCQRAHRHCAPFEAAADVGDSNE